MKRFPMMCSLVFMALTLARLPQLSAADESAGAKKDPDAKIKSALAKLPDADRKLAEAQRYCAVQPENRLGSMGAPIKIEVSGKTVFLCCAGCKEAALAASKATIAQAEKLKKINAALGKLNENDRAIAEQQRFCPVMGDSRLGSMGTPVSVEINGKKIFLCCDGCRDTALEDPHATLTKAEKLTKAKTSDKK